MGANEVKKKAVKKNSDALVARRGEWALVVGASAGLGASWAEECAKRGFNVIVCARRLEKLQEVTAGLRERHGVETREFVADISDTTSVETVIEAIDDLDVSVFIYNAAIEHVGYFIQVEESYHEQQIVGNALVPMRLSWHLARKMAHRNRGVILLCSSMAAVVGCGNNAVYGGVKSFEMQLAKGLWYEMRHYGVTVAGVTIGAIATPEFERVQAEQQKKFESDAAASGTSGTYKPAKATPPAQAAAYVMDHVGDGPQLYTSAGDRRASKLMSILPARVAVNIMGKVMDSTFSSGYETLDDEFTRVDAKPVKGVRSKRSRPTR